MSEYVPYFRRSEETMRRYRLGTGIYASYFRYDRWPEGREWEEWGERRTSKQRMAEIEREVNGAGRLEIATSFELAVAAHPRHRERAGGDAEPQRAQPRPDRQP